MGIWPVACRAVSCYLVYSCTALGAGRNHGSIDCDHQSERLYLTVLSITQERLVFRLDSKTTFGQLLVSLGTSVCLSGFLS